MLSFAVRVLLLLQLISLFPGSRSCLAEDSTGDTTLPGPDEWQFLSKSAEIVRLATPVYPDVSLQEGQEETLIVEALIDQNGICRDARLFMSTRFRLLGKAAMDAALKSEFKPAYDDHGFRVASWLRYSVEFKIDRSRPTDYVPPVSFRILLVRETKPKSRDELPEGTLLLWGGFNDGLKPGMLGVVKRENEMIGKFEIAYVEVTWVNGEEARCEYLMLDDSYFLEPWDRATFVVREPVASDILEQGLAAYTENRYEDALSYLDKIWCLSRTNQFVEQLTEQCRTKFESLTRDDIPKDVQLDWRRRKLDFLRLGKEFTERRLPHLAGRYINRVLLIDSTNQIGLNLKAKLPEDTFYEDKIRQCSLVDSILAGTRVPNRGERFPVDSLARLLSLGKAKWPATRGYLNEMIWLDIMVGTDNQPVEVLIRSTCGNKDLDETAVEAAQNGVYRSAYIGDQAVPMWIIYGINLMRFDFPGW